MANKPIDIEVARAICDAARIVRAGNRGGVELNELVQVGWERVLRYLGREHVSPTLAFVCAKQGMLAEVRRAAGRDQLGRRRRFPDPVFVAIDDRDVSVWDQWRRYALPLEHMIDVKRALLAMQLREAVAWYSHHWLCEGLDHLMPELGVSEARIRQYCRAARDKLAAAWAGEWFETEADLEERRATAARERDARRADANERMLAERRRRFAELRELGVSSKAARRASGSTARYAAIVRNRGEQT